jgi:hypothetical protein
VKRLALLSFLLLASPCGAQEVKLLKLDDSVGRDLLFKFPEESIGEIWNGEYAEKAREDWNAVRKALDADSKEGFEKAVAKFKDLQESAETRCDTVDDACARYREDHQDAFKHREKGKVTDDDVDVLIQDKKFTEWQGRVLRDYKAITDLRALVEGHTWLQWEEFWAQKKAWEDRHPGQAMLAKRTPGEERFFVDGNGGVHDKNPEKAESPPANAKEDAHADLPPPALAPADVIKQGAGRDEKAEKPAHAEPHKTKSAKKHSRTKKEEASTDPAVEIGIGIATSILGTQMGGHHGHSRREHGNAHSSGMKKTTSSRKTTTRNSTTKSGAGGSGATVNTYVGAPTITFGGGGVGF